MGICKLANHRFTDWPRDGVVLTHLQPLAIGIFHE